METLTKINDKMLKEYKKTEVKVQEIDQNIKHTNEEYQRIELYFQRVDDFDRKIEAMEENYEHIDNAVSRVGKQEVTKKRS